MQLPRPVRSAEDKVSSNMIEVGVNVRWGPKRITALMAGAVWLFAVPASPAAQGTDASVVPVGGALTDLSPGVVRRLSDERTITRWAYARRRANIQSKPSGSSRVLGAVRYYSSSGVDEVYGVRAVTVDAQGRRWLSIRLPMRPNGRTGWVLEDALGQLQVSQQQLTISRKTLRATLYDKGRKVWSSRVGVGTSSTPTPSGTYFVTARVNSNEFGPAYGNWTFLTNAYSRLLDWPGGGVVGVHGTNAPGLVPGRPSHGCVRIRNGDMAKLARRMKVGTPITIT